MKTPPKLGAMGRFLGGRLDPTDEGELTVAVAYDHINDLVRIEFGKPVAWVALPAEKARELAIALVRASASSPEGGKH